MKMQEKCGGHKFLEYEAAEQMKLQSLLCGFFVSYYISFVNEVPHFIQYEYN